MEQRNGISGFAQLLESGATRLRGEGNFTVELSPADLEQTMRQVVAQSEEVMKKEGVTAQIDGLDVQIQDSRGEVSTDVHASKRLSRFLPLVEADIRASFGLENITDQTGNPTGRLRSTHLEVTPETILVVYKPREKFAPKVEGENINESFRSVLDTEMQKRGAKIDNLNLAFTPQNTLKIAATGSRR